MAYQRATRAWLCVLCHFFFLSWLCLVRPETSNYLLLLLYMYTPQTDCMGSEQRHVLYEVQMRRPAQARMGSGYL
jgi:hypothetical protein